MYLCLEDDAAQAELLVIELAACLDAWDVNMSGANFALRKAKAVYAAAVAAAKAQYDDDTEACPVGHTWCIMDATDKRDAAIAVAGKALAAANAAHAAALTQANAVRDACIEAYVAKYLFCTS